MNRQNKETSAILNFMCVAELRVDVTGAVVDWKNKEMGAIFFTFNRIDLCKDLTVAILDWQYKEIAAILNHKKVLLKFWIAIHFSFVQGKEKILQFKETVN